MVLWLSIVPFIAAALWVMTARLLERSREGRRRDALLAAVGVPIHDLASIDPARDTTVEGVLRTGVADGNVASFHPHGSSFLEEPSVYAVTTTRGEKLEVDLDNGYRAVLELPVQVAVGHLETTHDVPLADAALLGVAGTTTSRAIRNGQFRVLHEGQRLRVHGRMVLAPDDDGAYREKSRVLRVLSPSPRGGIAVPVLLAAVDVPRIIRPRWSRSVVIMGLGIAATAALVPFVVTPRQRPTIAPVIVTPAPALSEPACRREVTALLRQNRWVDAKAGAVACGDPVTLATVQFAKGAFREASASFEKAAALDPKLSPSLSETEAHLFAHEPKRAAAAAHRMVEHFYPGPSTDERRYLECVAGLLDVLAERGLENPWPRPANRLGCGRQQLPRFAVELEDEGGMAGGYKPFAPGFEAVMGPASAVVGVRGRLRARPVAVERRILELYVEGKAVPRHPRGKRGAFGVLDAIWEEQGGDRYARLSGYAAELALFHSVNGLPNRAKPQFEMLDRIATALEKNTTFFRYNPVDGEAKADVRELIAEQSRDERDHLRLVMSVAAAAAHFANDEPRLKRYAAAGDPHSSGAHLQARRMMDPSRPWESPPIEDGHWADHMALFDAARSGDGKDVAALLATQHATGAETLPRIVPRLRTGEDALLRWFDERFPEPALNAGASVFLGHLTDRRVVARLVGRPQEADVLAPAVERFVDALTDPVIAYELDELETFFAPRQH